MELFKSPFKMIFGTYGRGSLCVEQKGVLWTKEFQSGLSSMCGGKLSLRKSVARGFPAWNPCDGHLFDHQSWLFAPNLTVFFLNWNYQ